MAVRLIGSCRLARGTRVRERWEGNKIVLEPINDQWSPAFKAVAGAWTEPIERPADGESVRDPFA